MKQEDIENKSDLYVHMTRTDGCCSTFGGSVDRRTEALRIAQYLNDFYDEHGRMPNQRELDVALGAGGSNNATDELSYEFDGDNA